MMDTRFTYYRAGFTETECDNCFGAILPSERRWANADGVIFCEECQAEKRGYRVAVKFQPVGSVHKGRDGWRFFPATPARQPSRVGHPSPERAVKRYHKNFSLDAIS